jgi:adenine-specific DNA methylase
MSEFAKSIVAVIVAGNGVVAEDSKKADAKVIVTLLC